MGLLHWTLVFLLVAPEHDHFDHTLLD